MGTVGFVHVLYSQQCFLQRRGAVGNLAVRQYLARLDGVAEPDLPRGNADLFRQQVNHALQGKFALAHTETPERAGRRIVGIVAVSADVRILVAVRTHGMGAGPFQHRSAQGCVGACVKVDITIQRRKDPVLVTAQRESSFHGVAFRVEVYGFLAAEPCLHRTLIDPGRQRGDMLDRNIFLPAKSAADQLVLYHHPLRFPAEHDGGLLAGVIDALIRAQDLDAVLVRKRHCAFRFQERVFSKRRRKRLRHRIGRRRQRCCRVTPGHMARLAKVAGTVYFRRVRRHRLGDGSHRCQRLIFDFDLFLCFFQDCFRLCNHQADGVAYAAGHISHGNHDIPVLLEMPDLVVRNIRRRQHADDAFHGQRFRRVDGYNPRPRVPGAYS